MGVLVLITHCVLSTNEHLGPHILKLDILNILIDSSNLIRIAMHS